MNKETISDAVLREFLLGGLDDEERDRIESQFLTDSQTRERILAAEQELIEDYLEDSFTSAERERFVSLYARTFEQRRKLRITKSIKDWATTGGGLPQTIPADVSIRDRLRNWLRLRPAIVPITVAIVIALVVVTVWLNRRIEERIRVSAIEQELAQLNSPSSLREVPPQMVRLELAPVTVRSNEQPKEVAREGVRFVELILPWTRERYSTYEVQLRRVDDDESFTIPDLQAGADWPTVRIRLSTHILRRGNYQVLLSGLTPEGVASPAEEYTFAVRD